MSKNLGTLTLDMLVNLTGFKRGMQDAEHQTQSSTKKMSGAFSSFSQSINDSLADTQVGAWLNDINAKFGSVNGSAVALSGALAGMAVGGSVLAFGAMSKIAIESARANMELQKFANLANSSVITFQGLAGASELLGINQDKLADQLKDFNEKLGEFASVGSGGATDFFEQIAVKTEKGAEGAKKLAKEMSGMNGVEALQKYVDKLEEAGVNQQQMSFYLESMGSDLTALIPILQNGGKLWKDYQQALEEAGVITSEQAIEKSALLQAQSKALQLQFGAVKSTLAEQMMPTLSNLIAHFMNGTNVSGQLSGVLTGLSAVAKGVAVVMVGLGSTIEGVVRFTRLAVENFAELGMTASNVFTAIRNQDIHGVTSALSHGFDNLRNNVNSFNVDTFANVNRSMQTMGDILSSNTAKADGLAQSILAINKASEKSVKYNQTGYTAGVAQNKTLNETAKAEKTAKATSARLNSAMEKAILWGASQLKIDPNHLASVISFETGGTFSTNARNPKSSGTGLIQFMDDADGKKDKLYYGMTRNEFGALSAMEQMQYVVKFLAVVQKVCPLDPAIIDIVKQ